MATRATMATMGTLYVVSTPIGNLEDITLRALRVLREVQVIAAEDTRHTRRLLQRHAIDTPCIAYHEHNKLSRLDDILTELVTGDVALVSDAGTPTLSDPGLELIQACIEAGFAVVPVPGASALLTALAGAGLPVLPCYVVGFLPRRKPERRAMLAQLASLPATLVCYEAPHRLLATLRDLYEVLGDRQLVVARELTKLHEQWLRTTVGGALEHFSHTPPRGEITLVIAGAPQRAGRASLLTDDSPAPAADEQGATEQEAQARARLATLHAAGERGSAAARQVAKEFRLPKQVVYQWWIELGDDTDTDTIDA